VTHDDSEAEQIRRCREAEQIRQWWEVEGLSAPEIAQRLRCTKESVTGRVRRMKLQPHGPSVFVQRHKVVDWEQVAAMRVKGADWHQVAAVFGLNTSTLRHRRDIYEAEGGLLLSPAARLNSHPAPQIVHEPAPRTPVPCAARRGARPLADMCQWPLSEGRPWRFCDDPEVAAGTPFCAAHAALAYQPTRPLTVGALGGAARV
jgi:hypothetical protein